MPKLLASGGYGMKEMMCKREKKLYIYIYPFESRVVIIIFALLQYRSHCLTHIWGESTLKFTVNCRYDGADCRNRHIVLVKHLWTLEQLHHTQQESKDMFKDVVHEKMKQWIHLKYHFYSVQIEIYTFLLFTRSVWLSVIRARTPVGPNIDSVIRFM